MSKKILLSILVIVVAIGLVGVGTYALWSDSVEVKNNEFAAGEMALLVGGMDAIDPGCDITDMYPGQTVVVGEYPVSNAGDVAGTLYVGIPAATVSGSGPFWDKLNYTIEVHDGVNWVWVAGGTLHSLTLADANLGTLGVGQAKQCRFSVTLDSSAGNDTQKTSCKFDALWRLVQQ